MLAAPVPAPENFARCDVRAGVAHVGHRDPVARDRLRELRGSTPDARSCAPSAAPAGADVTRAAGNAPSKPPHSASTTASAVLRTLFLIVLASLREATRPGDSRTRCPELPLIVEFRADSIGERRENRTVSGRRPAICADRGATEAASPRGIMVGWTSRQPSHRGPPAAGRVPHGRCRRGAAVSPAVRPRRVPWRARARRRPAGRPARAPTPPGAGRVSRRSWPAPAGVQITAESRERGGADHARSRARAAWLPLAAPQGPHAAGRAAGPRGRARAPPRRRGAHARGSPAAGATGEYGACDRRGHRSRSRDRRGPRRGRSAVLGGHVDRPVAAPLVAAAFLSVTVEATVATSLRVHDLRAAGVEVSPDAVSRDVIFAMAGGRGAARWRDHTPAREQGRGAGAVALGRGARPGAGCRVLRVGRAADHRRGPSPADALPHRR